MHAACQNPRRNFPESRGIHPGGSSTGRIANRSNNPLERQPFLTEKIRDRAGAVRGVLRRPSPAIPFTGGGFGPICKNRAKTSESPGFPTGAK
jgi:hypothetical protein